MFNFIKNKIRKFGILILSSLSNIKRNIWHSLISIFSTAMLLSLVGSIYVLSINANKLTSDIENNVLINVYIDTTSTELVEKINDENGNETNNPDFKRIYNEILKQNTVEKIDFSSKDDQLKQLIKRLGKTWSTFENTENPLYDVYIVKTKNPNQVKETSKKLKKILGVADVQYGDDNADKIIKLAKTTKNYGFIGIIILLVIVILLISNMVKLTIMSRKNEIQITRLVGAKDSYIRLPFIMESIWIGLLGSIIPILVISYTYTIFHNALTPALSSSGVSLLSHNLVLSKTSLLIIITGIIVGIISSAISMHKYLKI